MLFIKKFLTLSPIYKYIISGHSMSPALLPGQSVLVNRLSYIFFQPKTGELIAVKDPRDKKILIKRISKIKDGKYFVLGDNEKQSTDSRSFGWTSKNDIIGKVVFP
ncbi:MAG TPA: nickel-type superoxide dismutase maturation protease [Xanthomonadales bacterium]|nr:nickel-type superoxide dismutase maturation protease [Xanthomonadales bacterium]